MDQTPHAAVKHVGIHHGSAIQHGQQPRQRYHQQRPAASHQTLIEKGGGQVEQLVYGNAGHGEHGGPQAQVQDHVLRHTQHPGFLRRREG